MPLRDPWTRSSAFFRGTARDAEPDAPAAVPDGTVDDTERSRRGRRAGLAVAAMAVATLAAGLALPMTSASADPSAHTWYRLRMCESSDNYRTNTGNAHYGAYQFDVSTWRSVGGHGLPAPPSKAEQDARALILYRERGWQPWQCAGDPRPAGGRRRRLGAHRRHPHRSPAGRPASASSGRAGLPRRQALVPLRRDQQEHQDFQDQMHKRGYFPVGTGEYGPNTLRMVKQLQRLNGLIPNGYIGPNTWRTAWTGRYTAPAHRRRPRDRTGVPGRQALVLLRRDRTATSRPSRTRCTSAGTSRSAPASTAGTPGTWSRGCRS